MNLNADIVSHASTCFVQPAKDQLIIIQSSDPAGYIISSS